MTNTYTWSITPSGLKSITVDGQALSQVFTTLDWRLTGTDGSNVADVYGQVALGAPNPADFIQAANVTTTDLVSWLTTALGGSDAVTALKAQVDAKLALLANPPTFASNPVTATA